MLASLLSLALVAEYTSDTSAAYAPFTLLAAMIPQALFQADQLYTSVIFPGCYMFCYINCYIRIDRIFTSKKSPLHSLSFQCHDSALLLLHLDHNRLQFSCISSFFVSDIGYWIRFMFFYNSTGCFYVNKC